MGNELFCRTCKKQINEDVFETNEGFCHRCKVLTDDKRLKQKKNLLNFNEYKKRK